MGLTLVYETGQTPLHDDEKDEIKIPAITTRGELDEHEQRNIEDAIRWTIERRRAYKPEEILSEGFIKKLHLRMFGNVWGWAGSFRNTNKNLGVDKYLISTELRMLLDDCKYWIANQTFTDDEIAIRFKHRIVSIHCFANGNGRHSRLMADIQIEKIFKKEVFSWGSANFVKAEDDRKAYLAALHEADRANYESLIKFARS